MSFEIGPLHPIQRGNPAPRVDAPASSSDFSAHLVRAKEKADTAVVSIPATPPESVRDAIGAAAARAAELRAENRELHFRKDPSSNRVIVEVRDLAGNVIRTIPPSQALGIMSGAGI